MFCYVFKKMPHVIPLININFVKHIKNKMNIEFFKYQGAGNDFVMIDNRSNRPQLSKSQIALICDRKFGVGADGLVFLCNSANSDFEMIYYNSDGSLGSMCGNGGRCMVAFANALGLVDESCVFDAFDGLHHAEIISKEKVALQMSDLTVPENYHAGIILNTGSPHIVLFENSIDDLNIQEKGAEIRFSKTYAVEGVNVNFVKVLKDKLLIRTYERGVENETLACGTGAVASAIAAFESGLISTQPIRLTALGGDLEVLFSKLENTYTNIRLIGSAKLVFKGSIDV